MLLLPCRAGQVRVETDPTAANTLSDVPDNAQEEIFMLIHALAKDRQTQAPDPVAAVGEWRRLVYSIHGEVIEEMDAGCAR
ncbi:hypothetical protein ACWEP4_30485 [Streptomyces sp. NPDC004227]